jgi:D-aminopeptidase
MMSNGRSRLRDLGIHIGHFPTGHHNAITDVPGVLVGHKTVIRDEPAVVRTGVTVILPRDGRVHEDYPFAGFFSFNGIGEMSGLQLIEEWGVLTSPIVFTSTHQVGTAWDAITRYGSRIYGGFAYKLPVVAETYDGFLSDADSFPLVAQDVIDALESASSGPVAEGCVGGGTGMTSYDFKGGIGTSSRIVETGGLSYTIGAIVQANHGERHLFRVNGAPVGQILDTNRVPAPWNAGEENAPSPDPQPDSSSILIAVATDAPLLPGQCKRLARRAAAGMARTGGVGHNSSGDLFLAFSTGNHYDPQQRDVPTLQVQMIPHSLMNPLIEATAEVVEESILNALTAAQTMTGYQGRTAYALPLDALVEIMRQYPAPASS